MYNTNSQLVTTMFVWLFLSNVLFSTFVSNTSMKNNRTRNQPVSNTLLGLSTHCWIFLRFSLSRILELRIILLIFDVAYSMKISIIISTQDYECELLFILQELEWYDGSITICYHMSSSFFPQTYSDNGWSQSAILYQHTFIHFSIQWNYPFLVFYLFSAIS